MKYSKNIDNYNHKYGGKYTTKIYKISQFYSKSHQLMMIYFYKGNLGEMKQTWKLHFLSSLSVFKKYYIITKNIS